MGLPLVLAWRVRRYLPRRSLGRFLRYDVLFSAFTRGTKSKEICEMLLFIRWRLIHRACMNDLRLIATLVKTLPHIDDADETSRAHVTLPDGSRVNVPLLTFRGV